LEEEQNKRLSELQELLREKDPQPSSQADASSPEKSTTATLKDKIQQSTASIASTLTGQSRDAKKELDRAGVQKEIEELRSKLSKRKLKEEVVNDKQVEKARNDVVECLRVNDRRPLDCWQEVEAFRKEVGRLEGQFLGKVLE
jgi:MICOS complex subunit MIC19